MRIPATCVVLAVLVLRGAGASYPWQEDYARVTETGDIQWTPKPFRFVAGNNARYIDFENGSDANA